MDINFHYFAVKTLAAAAGFTENEAQRIAQYSQFVDDYDRYNYVRAKNIPSYIKDSDLDIVISDAFKIINPVTTGFCDALDLARLITNRNQKFIVSPFHLIPKNKSTKDTRTSPAELNDGSLIARRLEELKNQIQSGELEKKDYLMKMGMLFHTFADTYAHHYFSGYNVSTNTVRLVSVKNNITNKYETAKYHALITKILTDAEKETGINIPTIAHMVVVHVPDLSHISFSMEYTDINGCKYLYGRSNTDEYLLACRQIYEYMTMIKGSSKAVKWDELSKKLRKGFLVEVDSKADRVEFLTKHWKSIFTENKYQYHYSDKEIKDSFILNTNVNEKDEKTFVISGEEITLAARSFSDDFYKFNYFADLHLIALYGKHPRKTGNSIKISEINKH